MEKKMFFAGVLSIALANSAFAATKSAVLCQKSNVASDFAVSLLNRDLQQSTVTVRTLIDDKGNGTQYVYLRAPFTVSSPTLSYIPKTLTWSESYVACVTVTGEQD